MMLQEKQDIHWVKYFEQEVAKFSELDAHLAKAIRDDLYAKDLASQSTRWKSESQHQSDMLAEAKVAIASAKKTVRQRLRLQQFDEYRYGVNQGSSSAPVLDSSLLCDELDDLLVEDEVGGDNDGGQSSEQKMSDSDTHEGANPDAEPLGNCESAGHAGTPSEFDLASYMFPATQHLQDEFETLPNAELRSRFDHLLNQRHPDGRLFSYLEIRDEYCAIGGVMNSRGILPPKLRPQRSLPKLPKGQKYDPADTVMARDRQIMDLHWLHCRGKRDRLKNHKEFANLFAGDEFNFDLAAEFSCKGWGLTSKTVKVLNLLDFEQIQMAYFRMKYIDDAWRNGETIMNTTISKRLREWTITEPEFALHIEGLKQLWLAEKMVEVTDSIKKGEKVIGTVYGWLMNEEPLAKGTLNAKLKRMRRRTTPKSRRS